ncbi:putative DNA polymerase delta, small subunit [Mrakia frigida]|uniref:DNA-directed DNA polymerase delta subunit POL31 n=1 Tax=Mrakia frigida TaxID=29902 RepID=UPI003FCBF857
MATSSRPESSFSPLPELAKGFMLKGITRNYNHQYANMYFSRLSELSRPVKQRAKSKWEHAKGNPKLVDRVLDVQPETLCYIYGTIYMDMPLKPNVLEDISKDKWVTAPPPRAKYFSDDDEILLEDDSGRVKLVGDRIKNLNLVTGIIVAVLGYETKQGDFEVVDLCFGGIPPHAEPSSVASSSKQKLDDMEVDDDATSSDPGSWVAVLSGLDITGAPEQASDMRTTMMVEWLTGELGSDESLGGKVSRLVLAGNSLSRQLKAPDPKKSKVYGYDSSTYSTHPLTTFSSLFSSLSPLLPIHLLPGASDPSGTTLPQQPLPRLMFKELAPSKGFKTHTNPCWLEIGGKSLLATSGQNLDDVFKYVEGEDELRLVLAKKMLEWRHMAPTAPDTLWCHPFDETDPFILKHAPDVYIIGNQPRFETAIVNNAQDQPTRIILVPRFSQTGTLVLVHTKTLEVRTVEFGVPEGDDLKVEE